MPDSNDAAFARLRTIADRLEIPIEHFFDETWLNSHSLREECIRLCCLVTTDDGLARIIACVRDVIRTEQE